MTAVQWIGEPGTEGGVTEYRFDLQRDGGPVPGILWLPARPERRLPLVLMGHGGSGHKRSARQLGLGRWFAGESQIAAVAIDGPYHGDRVAEPLDAHQYQNHMAAAGVDAVTDAMVDDWEATVDALGELATIDADRVAYVGLSMGTRFGLPYVAAAGHRLRCAVLGKYGMRQPATMPAGVDMATRFTKDAPHVTVPILFHVQWDDELFPRAGQFELFELLGSDDKQLIAFPGPHRAAVPSAVTAWCDFMARHLHAEYWQQNAPTITRRSPALGTRKPWSRHSRVEVAAGVAPEGKDMPDADTVGHVARVTTLNCRPTADLSFLLQQAEEATRQYKPDLLVLPESCRGQESGTSEGADGPTVTAMARLARHHGTYVVCPIDRVADGVRWNSAILIDRTGEVVGSYDKMYPYWPELELEPPVHVGSRVPVWETDFGRLGVAICFDVNFASVWNDFARGAADVVVWTSAYAGGSILGAYARIHHYYIVTCTQTGDSHAYDMTGDEVKGDIAVELPVSSFGIDLDRQIYHENFNLDKLDRLLREKPDDVELEAHLEAEQWFVLRSRKAGVRVRSLAASYGLESLRDYVARSTAHIDDLRRS